MNGNHPVFGTITIHITRLYQRSTNQCYIISATSKNNNNNNNNNDNNNDNNNTLVNTKMNELNPYTVRRTCKHSITTSYDLGLNESSKLSFIITIQPSGCLQYGLRYQCCEDHQHQNGLNEVKQTLNINRHDLILIASPFDNYKRREHYRSGSITVAFLSAGGFLVKKRSDVFPYTYAAIPMSFEEHAKFSELVNLVMEDYDFMSNTNAHLLDENVLGRILIAHFREKYELFAPRNPSESALSLFKTKIMNAVTLNSFKTFLQRNEIDVDDSIITETLVFKSDIFKDMLIKKHLPSERIFIHNARCGYA